MPQDIESIRVIALERPTFAELVVDVWRISKRAVRDSAPESVRIACDRAIERLEAMGIDIDEMLGATYHENMRATVVHRDGDGKNATITECISPAVYYSAGAQRELIRTAEVVLSGGVGDE